MAGTITEVAPGRRRHSSVGLILGPDHPHPHHHHPLHHHHPNHQGNSRLPGNRSPEIRIQSSLFAAGHNDFKGRGVVMETSHPGGRKGDRGSSSANTNGRMARSVSDPRSRSGGGPDTKIMVLGMAAVGKSALVVRFLTNRFIWEYDPTLESTYRHVTTIDEEPAVMEILDTAGQGEMLQREGSVRWADGYVLVYAINDRASFDSMAAIKQHLDEVKKTNVQCVLLANKADLLHERRVQLSEGEALAQDMACAFYETSASDGGNDITEAFHELHREIKRRKMMENKGRRRSSAQQVRNVFNRVLNKIGSAS